MLDKQKNTRDYTNILPRGKKNAKSVDDLTKQLGYENSRSLRNDIAKSRIDGQQVICSTISGGYFLPESPDEVKEFVDMLTTKIIGISLAMNSAKKWLKDFEEREQLSLDDYEGGI